MAFKLSTSQRSAMAAALETDIGASGVVKIYTGSEPTNITDAASGTELVSVTLPADVFTESSGVLSLSATVSGSATATGEAGYYRLFASDGTTVKQQGDVGEGSGTMSLDNTDITSGQTVNITGYQLTMPNA